MDNLLNSHWQDFEVNLIAGIVILVIDAVLIVLLLPVVLAKINRYRWRKTRKEFILELLRFQRAIVDKLRGRAKNFADFPPPSYTDEEWQNERYKPLFPDMVAELEAFERTIDTEAAIYAISLAPSDHLAFVAWRGAIKGFREELNNLAYMGWLHILGRNVSAISDDSFMKPLILAFSKLNSATKGLVNAGEIGPTIAANKGQVSVFPEDSFDPVFWDGMRTTHLVLARRA